MQLLHETKVGLGNSPLALDKLNGLSRGPVELRHQERCHNADTPADPLDTVNEHPGLRVSCQSICDPCRRGWQVGGQFRKWKVLDAYLQASGLHREERWWWDKNLVRDSRQYVGDFVLRKADRTFSEREVRDVKSGYNFRYIT